MEKTAIGLRPKVSAQADSRFRIIKGIFFNLLTMIYFRIVLDASFSI